jgi:hypothetical protein
VEKDHGRIEIRRAWVVEDDASRIRKDNAPENLATLRKIVINLIKKQKNSKVSIRSRLKKAAWDNSYLETLLVS